MAQFQNLVWVPCGLWPQTVKYWNYIEYTIRPSSTAAQKHAWAIRRKFFFLLTSAQILDADSLAEHHMCCQLTLALHRSGLDFKQTVWDLYWFPLHAGTHIDALNIVAVCCFGYKLQGLFDTGHGEVACLARALLPNIICVCKVLIWMSVLVLLIDTLQLLHLYRLFSGC